VNWQTYYYPPAISVKAEFGFETEANMMAEIYEGRAV
jgi:hypothetical protein